MRQRRFERSGRGSRTIRHDRLAPVVILLLFFGCSRSEPPRAAMRVARSFVDVTEKAGIGHRHFKPVLDHKLDNIMNWVASVGAAAAAGDFDRDGWLDLYVTNSRKGRPNYLYRNNGDGTFTDVAATAGVADVNGEDGVSTDCVWGDFDNDGWIDLYVVRWGRDVLFRNNGDPQSPGFTDVTERHLRRRDGSGGADWANGCAAIFLDYNLDGRLDIYVGNYFDEIDLWHLPHTRIMHEDFERARNGGKNYLYRQEQDGTFSEVAPDLGLDDPGWTLAVGSADLNNDGWPDLYCADDFGPDQLFYNNADRAAPGFTNVSQEAIGFDTKKGMNVDFGDFNNDGWLDIYVANITTAEYLQEGNMLWHNNGPGAGGLVTFTDIAIETGTYDGGWGWGAKFFDYDNDGDLDLLAVNGFISEGEGNYWFDLASWTVLGQDAAEATNWPAIGDRSFSGYEPYRFWRNDGLDTFTQAATEVGLDSDRDGRGLVCFDYDNDGDLDVFVANHDQAPLLYRNDHAGGGHWIMVALEVDSATGVNADGVGTRVTVVSDGGTQIRERDGGNGYAGQSDPRLHFGLGADASASLIEVRWPDGGLQYIENVAADRLVSVRQDQSQYVERPMLTAPKPTSRSRVKTPKKIKVAPEEMNRFLLRMEAEIRSHPGQFTQSDAYRGKCVEWGLHERSIDFFVELSAANSGVLQPKVSLAAAYIDKIPTCGGLAAVVSKGTLANKALNVLNAALDRHGSSWVTHYARGMNHLHWPRMLRHSDDAIRDFEWCLAAQAESDVVKPHFERIYVALGDAHAKNKSYAAARRVWRNGLAMFPQSKPIQSRLAIVGDGALDDFVMDARSLERPIDTSFAFLERE